MRLALIGTAFAASLVMASVVEAKDPVSQQRDDSVMMLTSQDQQSLALQNKKAGQMFLEENQNKPGIQTTSSGLQYKVITEGNGAKPKPTDTVLVDYEGRFINGNVFDSSYQRGEPISFPVNGVIKGWQEALTLMPMGSTWEVYIPSELAYGQRGVPGVIGPNETLIFKVHLIDIK